MCISMSASYRLERFEIGKDKSGWKLLIYFKRT